MHANIIQFPFDVDRDVELPIVEDKGDWIRVPFSGRIEVRTKENRFKLKESVIEVISRRWTVDNSQLVRRDMLAKRTTDIGSDFNLGQSPASPVSHASGSLSRNQTGNSTIGMPGGMSELPAALSGLVVSSDTKSLPPYPGSVGTPTERTGSSVAGPA